jgi:hypothetical protein
MSVLLLLLCLLRTIQRKEINAQVRESQLATNKDAGLLRDAAS